MSGGFLMEFFCYAYGRLSKEDLDKKVESDSIKNQRDLIHSFIDRDPELHLVMEGYDDGYTGTSFDRPHVREMLEAVKSGKVNCVVVKDDCEIIRLNGKPLAGQGLDRF
jgi:DNA invertase Pin-like site-specific DNA recombinase